MGMKPHADTNNKSESTEESLWKAYWSDKTDCENRNKIAVFYHPRMKTIVKTHRGLLPNIEFDDLCQIAAETLLKAIKNFKPELGYKFATYLSAYIEKGFLKIRDEERKSKDSNFNDEDVANTDVRIEDAAEQTIEMDAMLFELTLQERKALELRYKDDKTISETAERMKISERRVHKLLETGKKKLRKTKKDDQ